MKLNLLLNIEDYKWANIKLDRTQCIEKVTEVVDLIRFEEDDCWQHPSFFALCYEWGCMHHFICELDYPTAQELTGGWMKLRHFNALRNLFKLKFKNQKHPFCYSLSDLEAKFPDRINGIVCCKSTNETEIDNIDSRHELIVKHYSQKNHLINWENAPCFFLPNLHYSNLHLSEKLGTVLDTDLVERRKQINNVAKFYCDSGHVTLSKGTGAKEALASEVGTEIARRNFYQFENELSAKEAQLRKSMRKIFSINKEGNKVHISIDFEKGCCFEICDHNGRHQGEYRFDGTENGKPGRTKDNSGKHDILALK